MSQRPILTPDRTHPATQKMQTEFHAEFVKQVQDAVKTHAVVVVGMAQNPWPAKARKLLKSENIPYHSLVYGSYLSKWKERLALKMWAGWPTFPMVFVHGMLVGGFSDLKALHESGELKILLQREPE